MAAEAARPFKFINDAAITRIGGEYATTICDLHRLMGTVSDASVFQHTFRSLETYHYLTEGFSNDFAQWVLAACNENALAEQLAAVDLRDHVALAEVRARLVRVAGDYIKVNPAACDRSGFEPFYFMETVSVEVPTGVFARNLSEFAQGVALSSLSSIHFHFLTSRLRLELKSNDFSLWLSEELKLPELAQKIERIDIYANTLEGVRGKIVKLAEPYLES